jgi:hypothetical protein
MGQHDELVCVIDQAMERIIARRSGDGKGTGKSKGRGKGKSGKLSMIPNRQFTVALDRALQSAGLSLKQFLPQQLAQALSASQERFLMELSPETQIFGSSVMRSCIVDKATGETWVEVPRSRGVDGFICMPTLHKALDEGSIGLYSAHFLDLHIGIRSTFTEDPWHRYFNDLKDALVSEKLWAVVCERTVVFNVNSAPYGNHGFYGHITAAAEEYFRTRTSTCMLFRALYEDFLRLEGEGFCLVS